MSQDLGEEHLALLAALNKVRPNRGQTQPTSLQTSANALRYDADVDTSAAENRKPRHNSRKTMKRKSQNSAHSQQSSSNQSPKNKNKNRKNSAQKKKKGGAAKSVPNRVTMDTVKDWTKETLTQWIITKIANQPNATMLLSQLGKDMQTELNSPCHKLIHIRLSKFLKELSDNQLLTIDKSNPNSIRMTLAKAYQIALKINDNCGETDTKMDESMDRNTDNIDTRTNDNDSESDDSSSDDSSRSSDISHLELTKQSEKNSKKADLGIVKKSPRFSAIVAKNPKSKSKNKNKTKVTTIDAGLNAAVTKAQSPKSGANVISVKKVSGHKRNRLTATATDDSAGGYATDDERENSITATNTAAPPIAKRAKTIANATDNSNTRNVSFSLQQRSSNQLSAEDALRALGEGLQGFGGELHVHLHLGTDKKE